MKSKNLISLADIARESGVAKSTVSRILNNTRQGFSAREETRQRVLEVAQRLNYRPNPIARSVRAKKTNLIALLGLHDLGTDLRGATEEAVNRMLEVFMEHGYEMCTNILSKKEPPFAPPRWRVDGAVAIDCSDPSQLEALDESGLPYVALNGRAGKRGSSVRVDDEAGMREAMYHLMALGHTRIAYALPHEGSWHESQATRREAYLKTLREANLQPIPGYDRNDLTPMDIIRLAVLEHKATAIIAYHHVLAVRLMRAAATFGIRIPHQLSLVCFNDVLPCADLVPSLTAVSLPSRLMGQRAAEILLEQMNSDKPLPPQQVLLKEQLVIRESTAPPPG